VLHFAHDCSRLGFASSLIAQVKQTISEAGSAASPPLKARRSISRFCGLVCRPLNHRRNTACGAANVSRLGRGPKSSEYRQFNCFHFSKVLNYTPLASFCQPNFQSNLFVPPGNSNSEVTDEIAMINSLDRFVAATRATDNSSLACRHLSHPSMAGRRTVSVVNSKFVNLRLSQSFQPQIVQNRMGNARHDLASPLSSSAKSPH